MPRTKSQPIKAWQVIDEQLSAWQVIDENHKFFAEAIEREAREVRQVGDIDVVQYIELYRAKTGAVISDSTAIKWLNEMPGVKRIEKCLDPVTHHLKTVWRPVR